MKKNESYFKTQPYLQNRFDRVGRAMAFRAGTRREWQTWRRKLLRKLKELTGYDTMVKTDPRPRITEEVDLGDLIRQRLELFTEPRVVLTAYVLIPKHVTPPCPVVITPHGHSSGGKYSVAGRHDIPGITDQIKRYNYDYGVQFAREGFITICPDARGFGERLEEASGDDLMLNSCLWINQMAYPLGQTVTGMWAWDIHRLIDYASSRDDCIASRIACAGLSGGGLQTLWASALDTRIRSAVISGYMYGYKESLLDQHTNCSCNYVPHLYEHVDMGDIAALIAPRPLLIETGTRDNLNGSSGLKNVRSQVRIIRRAYRLLAAPRMLSHDVFEGEHRWHGAKAIPWVKRHLGT